MTNLPSIVPDGCTLSSGGLADQAGRAVRLLPSVVTVQRSEDELLISFRDGVDRSLVQEVVATEQQCCSVLKIEYDGAAGTLRVAAHDRQGREMVSQMAEFFGAAR